MDARFELRIRCALTLIISGLIIACGASRAQAYGVRTANFLVDAPSPQLAKQIADAAEKYRRDLAVYWTGRELPTWPQPCPVSVVAGNHPAQGVTVYNQKPVGDFRMEVIGTPERILDSVLPHEITHTVLATHFGRPLPRWADEGICTTVEHPDEKNKHEIKLREFLNTHRGIPMNKMFLLTEYPQDILPMYAQGYSVCRFLIEQKDARAFVAFLGDYMQNPSWTKNIHKHYGYDSLVDLQENWVAWVAAGSGPVDSYVANPMSSTTGDINLVAAAVPATESARSSATNPGWYTRTRDGQAQHQITRPAAGTALAQLGTRAQLGKRGATPIAGGLPDLVKPLNSTLPPSVRNAGRGRSFGQQSSRQYSSVHPQAEQRIARQRAATEPESPATARFDPGAVRYYR